MTPMLRVMCRVILGCSAVLLVCPGEAQERGTNSPRPRVYLDRIDPHWFDDGEKFWYRRDLPGDRREFVIVEAKDGTRRPAFDHAKVAERLSGLTGKDTDPERLPIDSLEVLESGTAIRLTGPEGSWDCDFKTYYLRSVSVSEPRIEDGAPRGRRPRRREAEEDRSRSPDGKWEVIVEGHNLVLNGLKENRKYPLTYDGNPTSSYSRDARRERLVEMQYEAVDRSPAVGEIYWSPDSRRFVAMRFKPGTERTVYLVASSPEDQLQPKLESYPYLKPGDDLPTRKPHLFDVENRREIAVADELFAQPWSIEDVRWASNSMHFTFVYNQRGHQMLRIVKTDANKGKSKPVIDETSQTFICYSGKYFCEYLDETQEIIWMSERDGWNHLYLYDAALGTVKNQITSGQWVVRQVDHVDRKARRIWFRAGGIWPGQDPYYVHHCSIRFDGTDLKILTEGNGTHSVQYSPDRRYLVDTWSRVDYPAVTELRRSEDGRRICLLESADAGEVFRSGWSPPEPFVAKGRDGSTDIYGIIHRPREFDPTRRYPVVEQIYAGPQSSYVAKAFRSSYSWDSLRNPGFVLVQIDGMGTSDRSKAFHDVCWKNLGDAGLPDRIAWMKAAAAQRPWMDLERVGVYGGSAGGQNALGAVLQYGDFYKAAAADCGCHDNRLDKIWWNEQWMGWPVGPHYAEQSNITLAPRLRGKLLLTVGELDRNVDPASTFRVVDALIKADRDFDLIVFPGRGHGAGGSRYGERRRNEFFVRHLLAP